MPCYHTSTLMYQHSLKFTRLQKSTSPYLQCLTINGAVQNVADHTPRAICAVSAASEEHLMHIYMQRKQTVEVICLSVRHGVYDIGDDR